MSVVRGFVLLGRVGGGVLVVCSLVGCFSATLFFCFAVVRYFSVCFLFFLEEGHLFPLLFSMVDLEICSVSMSFIGRRLRLISIFHRNVTMAIHTVIAAINS